jgi:putative FmdB family regulatory protein
MPLYEYHCDNCDKDFELLMAYHYADSATCPECGGNVIRKPSKFKLLNFPIKKVTVKGEEVV